MRYVIRLLAALCCALAGLHAGPANAEKRLALSVGIDVYDNLPASEQLKKAVNDARAMAAALRELGFEATVEENLPRLAFTRAWQKFLNRLEPGDTAALYFAGHGVVVGGVNYLLPRDVPKVELSEDKVLAGASIRFNDLMDDLRDKKVRVSLFIVDACRDNPFRDGRGRFVGVGGTRGLAVVEPAKGTFVMYSAGAGERALDRLSDSDRESNSPYTRALLPILKTPGLSMHEIAVRVRREVIELAREAQPPHEQTPAYYDQLVGEFVLKAGSKPAAQPPSSDAERAWAAAKDTTSIAVLEAFRRQYGASNAFYDHLAEARIEELGKQQLAMLKADEERRLAEGDLLRPGRVFRDCPDCPEMVVVPAGEFIMGSPASEAERNDDEGPQRKVTIPRPFAVGKFEVTFIEWEACVTGDGCKSNPRPSDSGRGKGRRPVVNVSWHDAKEYADWLSRKTGKSYRLLSEAEWEYAARAGTTTRYAFGHAITQRQAQFKARWTALVGSFPANKFGLHDMHGNATEWVEDNWHPDYQGAPIDGSVWSGGDTSLRVLRGGDWRGIFPTFLRSASRFSLQPNVRDYCCGFRLSRTL